MAVFTTDRLAFSLALFFCLLTAAMGTHDKNFDTTFARFLADHGYTGGAVAALKDGRLVLAKGYGVMSKGSAVKAWSRVPMTRLSQSVTAVAVMTLVQRGALSLGARVFGREGILHMIRPVNPASADPRLYNITVGNLLRHSAGWDSSRAPLFDPVLNDVYLAQGRTVPNIARAMDASSPLDAFSLIQYVISHPLHFTPGTRVRHSNVGYVILGRVLEEASKTMYEDYVKRSVLVPCGMWRTKVFVPTALQAENLGLEDGLSDEFQELDIHRLVKHNANLLEDSNIDRLEGDSQNHREEEGDLKGQRDVETSDDTKTSRDTSMMEVLDPLSVDSALGWSSTVLDLLRLSRCVFVDNRVLHDDSLQLLLQPQDTAVSDSENLHAQKDHYAKHGNSWVSAGFMTNQRGEVWQESDPRADDVILFHDLRAGWGKEGPVDTWAVALHGSHVHHLHRKLRDVMQTLKPVPRSEGVLADLSDVSRTDKVLVKFRVDEHHLDAYVSAVRREGYDVTWVFPYSQRRQTAFIVISHPATQGQHPQPFYVDHGLSEKQLLSRKLHYERQGFNLTFLQSYHSRSHQHHQSFLAIFRHHAYMPHTQLKYGTGHLPEPYDRLVQMYREKHFHPLVQSVLHDNSEERLSFVFVHTGGSAPVNFTNSYGLNATQLDAAILNNTAQGLQLAFLDAYTVKGDPYFAAVFTNITSQMSAWQPALSTGQAVSSVQSHLSESLLPTMAVAFTDSDQRLKVSLFFKADGN